MGGYASETDDLRDHKNVGGYRRLRNYYNQRIHDIQDRRQASAFLHQWVGAMPPVEEAAAGDFHHCQPMDL